MYKVQMQYECNCFKKSEYSSEKSFETQKDAYNYANILTDLMNDEFCTTHLFTAFKLDNDDFIIGVADNPDAGGSCSTDNSCSTGSCGCQ